MILCAACRQIADPHDYSGNAIVCTCEREEDETIPYADILEGEEIECEKPDGTIIHGFVLMKTDDEAKVVTANGDRYVYPDYTFFKLAA